MLILPAALRLLPGANRIYGVMARGLNERTREFRVSVALGSYPGAVLWLIVAGALRCVAARVPTSAAAAVILAGAAGFAALGPRCGSQD